MLGAIKAASEGMGINRAALEFGVPKTTLKDRMPGRVQHGSKLGRVPYLSSSEEQELVDYLITCSEIGYPKKRADVLGIVQKTLENKNGGPIDFNGKGWWFHFMQCYPELAIRKGDAISALTYPTISTTSSALNSTFNSHLGAITTTSNPTLSTLSNVISTLNATVSTPSSVASSSTTPSDNRKALSPINQF